MTPELRGALDNAWQVFGRYKDEFHMARRCKVNHPLRLMTCDDWRIMNTKFDINVLLWSNDAVLLRHFLPLWMEWMSEDEDDFLFSVRVTSDFSYRLNAASWLNWPLIEVEAVRRVLLAWTHEVLADPEARMFPYLLLTAEEDVSPYFDLWLEARPVEVAHWILEQDWIHPQPSALTWLLRPRVEGELENAFFAHPDGANAALLSRSIELVRSLRPMEA